MNSSKYRFTLDMHMAQSQVSLPIALNDTARQFYISLADGGKIYHIADGYLAVVRIGRPTGTYIEQFCPIEDNTNIVYDFALNTNTAIIEGLHKCEVTLYGPDGGVVTTARFTMVVGARVVNSDNIIVTDASWTMIDNIAVEEAKRQDGFKKAVADVEAAIEGIDDAIDEIVPPRVGENGNWFVHGEDTGVQAQGNPGVYVGSGVMPEGYNVQVDPDGDDLKPILRVKDGDGNVREIAGIRGSDGRSAYEIALDHGFKGTEAEWLASLEPDPMSGEDKEAIVAAVLEALPTWNGGDY